MAVATAATYWLLSVAVIAAAVLRVSYISVAYLLIVLVTWHFPATLATVRISACVTTLLALATCIAHVVFQIYLASDEHSRKRLQHKRLTSYGVSVLGSPAETSLRLVAPDVLLLAVAAAIWLFARKRLAAATTQRSSVSNDVEDDPCEDQAVDVNVEAGMQHVVNDVQHHADDVNWSDLNVLLLCLTALNFTPPSLPSALYLCLMLAVLISVAIKLHLSRLVLVVKSTLAACSFVHLIALFLFQVPEVHESTSTETSRFFGLYIYENHQSTTAPQPLEVQERHWSLWVLPFSLLLSYYVVVLLSNSGCHDRN